MTIIDPIIPVAQDRDAADNGTIDLTGRAPAVTTRPTFTITDAAAACAVSRKTITRKLGDLALHGAAKDDDGIWRIPVEALLAVGLHPGRSLPPTPTAPRAAAPASAPAPAPVPVVGATEPAGDVVTVPRQRWDDLRIRLARAEAEASERALALADARLALRALTAGPARSEVGVAGGADPHGTPAVPASPAGGGSAALQATLTSPSPAPGPQDGAAPTPPAPAEPAAAPAAPVPAALPAPGLAEEPRISDEDPVAQVAAARAHAARNGGYVPASTPAAPERKRRWWQSR